MKVTRIFLLAALTASINAHAQFAIAPVAGINTSYSYTAIENHLYKSSTAGLKAGLISELELSEGLYTHIGALYSSYGFTNLNVTLDVDAIEVPVSIVYKTGKPGQNRFFAGAGPYIGFQLKSTLKVTDMYFVESKRDATAGMKRTYLGIDINAGYQMAEGVFTRVSFQPGISQLIKPDASFTGYYSAQGSISVGYMIGSRKCTQPQAPKQ